MEGSLDSVQDVLSQEILAEISRQLDNHRNMMIQAVSAGLGKYRRLHTDKAGLSHAILSDVLSTSDVNSEGSKLAIPLSHCSDVVDDQNDSDRNIDAQDGCEIKATRPRQEPKRGYTNSTFKNLSGNDQVATSMLDKVVQSNAFEISCACLIVVNILAICWQTHYQGLTLGHELGVPGYSTSGADIWPKGEHFLRKLNLIFSILFTVELVLQGIVHKLDSLKSSWMWFDFIIVLVDWIDFLGYLQFGPDPMVLRMFRLIRMLKMLRSMKNRFKSIETLFLLVKSIQSGVVALMWSFLLLCIVQITVGVVLCRILNGFINDETKLLDA